MKLIRLTQNKFAKVDTGDLWWMMRYKWQARKITRAGSKYCSYFAARSEIIEGKLTTIYMHREITHCPPNKKVYHINGDTLDNRRENLRICSRQENNKNRYRS